ncbi:hypothetical protein ACHAXR_010086 [Thalassiosira sp. AJA248-18]
MSWQAPLTKLILLIVLLPFTATYLHLYYYAYWKNEYCFVGPHASMISGRQYDTKIISNAIDSVETVNVDNQIRVESTTNQYSSITQFHGIYAPISQKKKKGESNVDRRQFQQKYATTSSTDKSSYPLSWFWSRGWPSITQSAVMISSPSSQLSNHQHLHKQQDISRNSDHAITFVDDKEEKRWCLQSSSSLSSSSSEKWCSEPLPNYPEGTIYTYPPSGIWNSAASNAAATASTSPPSLDVSCPTPTTYNPSKDNSRHKQQNAKQNQNVQFILNHPATTLLLLFNTALAFHYWNHRIAPAAVCKQYTKIVVEHEWWRGLTGATAHFEPLHIGFNMMSLHTLGRELEGGFGSIVFLVYNIALVVFTTTVMMAMVYARLRWIQHKLAHETSNPQLQTAYQEQQQRLRETSSVGYSAVLFAWMVVSTMERKQPTCPIPFLNDVCFSTYSVPGLPFLKFNISPIVSLFMAQFIMPRVSFMGHLAGIVCGFFLHWGWVLPPLEICSPNVLIGGVFLFGLICRKRVIPVRPLLTAMMDEEGCMEHEDYLRSLITDGALEDGGLDGSNLGQNRNGTTTDPFMRSKQKKKERELNEVRQKQKTLITVRNLIGIVTLASPFVFGLSSSLILSQCVLLAYFTFATQSSLLVWTYTHSKSDIQPEKVRSGMIWRGLFMSATLSIVVDSMSLAAWFALPTLIIAAGQPSLPIGLLSVSAFMVIRMSINFLALVLSSAILHATGMVGDGIFTQVFSIIFHAKQIGDGVLVSQKPLWTAFEGRGITLGR